ncbi:MAG TPA: hypothetical protein VLH08_08135 [Acidobacteriota bacterium]|nr:hypothetical protein [Acidobacteriota bacterium]
MPKINDGLGSAGRNQQLNEANLEDMLKESPGGTTEPRDIDRQIGFDKKDTFDSAPRYDIDPGFNIGGKPTRDIDPGFNVGGKPTRDIDPGFNIGGKKPADIDPGFHIDGRPGKDIDPGFNVGGKPTRDIDPGFNVGGKPGRNIDPGFNPAEKKAPTLDQKRADTGLTYQMKRTQLQQNMPKTVPGKGPSTDDNAQIKAAAEQAEKIFKAGSGIGTDEKAIKDVLEHVSSKQMERIDESFKKKYGTSLKEFLASKLSDQDMKELEKYKKTLRTMEKYGEELSKEVKKDVAKELSR